MKYFKPLILILLIINLCLSNEFFNGYSLNQNPISDTLPTKPIPPKPTFGIIASEFGGGFIGWACGAIIGGLVGWVVADKFFGASISYEPDWGTITSWGLIGGYIFGSLGSALGTYIVGNAFHQNGKFLPTLAGSASGLLVLSPFGSVIGYNLSRPKPVKQSFLYQHFDLPSCCIRTEKTKENKIIPVLDFRLVSTRF